MDLVPLSNQGEPDFTGLYFLASLCRMNYLTTIGLEPFQQTKFGFGGLGPVRWFDQTLEPRISVIALDEVLVCVVNGLLLSDWPYVLKTGTREVDASGVFAGRVMLPVLDRYSFWAGPAFDLLSLARPFKHVIFTGHSFGGALAVLLAWEHAKRFRSRNVEIVSFGAPHFASEEFWAALPCFCLRVENSDDWAPLLPPGSMFPAGGKGLTVFRSGIIYDSFAHVKMPDGRTLTAARAEAEETLPKCRITVTGREFTGNDLTANLIETRTTQYDPHSSIEYARGLRRFFGFDDVNAVDRFNNTINGQTGVDWRIAIMFHTIMPWNPQVGIQLPLPAVAN